MLWVTSEPGAVCQCATGATPATINTTQDQKTQLLCYLLILTWVMWVRGSQTRRWPGGHLWYQLHQALSLDSLDSLDSLVRSDVCEMQTDANGGDGDGGAGVSAPSPSSAQLGAALAR